MKNVYRSECPNADASEIEDATVSAHSLRYKIVKKIASVKRLAGVV
jgi:hypothetical protein